MFAIHHLFICISKVPSLHMDIPQRMATAEWSPAFPYPALPLCTLNPLPAFQYLFTLQAHFNGSDPSVSLIPFPSILFSFILHKLILLNSYGMYKTSQSIMLLPLYHSTIHSHCSNIHTKTHTHFTTLSISSWHINTFLFFPLSAVHIHNHSITLHLTVCNAYDRPGRMISSIIL